jgi:hypothetical protein
MEKPHKAHRASTSGGKAEKKKAKETSKGFNEKVCLVSIASQARLV